MLTSDGPSWRPTPTTVTKVKNRKVDSKETEITRLLSKFGEQLRTDIKNDFQEFLEDLRRDGPIRVVSEADVDVVVSDSDDSDVDAMPNAWIANGRRNAQRFHEPAESNFASNSLVEDDQTPVLPSGFGIDTIDFSSFKAEDDLDDDIAPNISASLANLKNKRQSIKIFSANNDNSRSVKISNEEQWQRSKLHPYAPYTSRPNGLIVPEHESLLPGDGMDGISEGAVPPDGTSNDQGLECTAGRVFVLSVEFDQLIGLLVFLNALSIGFETDYQAVHIEEDLPFVYTQINAAFCAVFTLELILKLIFLGGNEYFCGDNALWQIFDFLIVGVQIADIVFTALPGSNKDSGSAMNLTVFRLLRLVRFARILRIIRLFRTLKLIDDLNSILYSITASMRTLWWALLVLFAMVYVVGILFTHLVTDARATYAKTFDQSQADILMKWYGSLWQTVLTMFESIAGGVQWAEVVHPLTRGISPWAGLIYVLYVAFTVFALLNVVTGIFVGKALDCANKLENEKLVDYLSALFLKADSKGSGFITWPEFKQQLKSEELTEYFELIDVDVGDAKLVFDLIDEDGSGSVDRLEFVSGCLRLRGAAKAVDLSLVKSETKKMRQWLKSRIAAVEKTLTKIEDQLHQRAAATAVVAATPV